MDPDYNPVVNQETSRNQCPLCGVTFEAPSNPDETSIVAPEAWRDHVAKSHQEIREQVEVQSLVSGVVWCPWCPDNTEQFSPLDFYSHVTESHFELFKDIITWKRGRWLKSQWEELAKSQCPQLIQLNWEERLQSLWADAQVPRDGDRSQPRLRSRSRSDSPPRRSNARPATGDFDRGVYLKGKLWTPDDDPSAARRRPFDRQNVATQRQRPSSGSLLKTHRQPHTLPSWTPAPAPPIDHDPTEIIKEPVAQPISQEQLVAEVKGIYAGLVMVESKCIEVDNNQSAQNDPANKLNNDQFMALIALHRTLLHEHHDFFLASQHPSASPALRRLAANYAMPARMWRHGIHSFLEVLRARLPASLDHMLTFIYTAYNMMALLYETVPAFEDTWIECLGDLGRYRMAIEDDDMRDREVWTGISQLWYSRASDKAPTTGRLYHHLAILARPNVLQQLYYYTKSLCVEIPFLTARESIMTLFEPLMSRTPNSKQARLLPPELSFMKIHGTLFSGKQDKELKARMKEFFDLLDDYTGHPTRCWLVSGYHIGIANICALTGYGSDDNPITQAMKMTCPHQEQDAAADSQDQPMQEDTKEDTTSTATTAPAPDAASAPRVTAATTSSTTTSSKHFPDTSRLFTRTYDIVARDVGDPKILPFLHVTLAFVHHLTFCPDAMAHVAPHFPWKRTANMLNTLIESSVSSASDASDSVSAAVATAGASSAVEEAASASASNNVSRVLAQLLDDGEGAATFPGWAVDEAADNEKTSAPKGRPLPEDFAQRGLPWVKRYFPDGWFDTEERMDYDDKYFEVPSMKEERQARVIWLGWRIARQGDGKWLQFDKESGRFEVSPEYDIELDLDPGTSLSIELRFKS